MSRQDIALSILVGLEIVVIVWLANTLVALVERSL